MSPTRIFLTGGAGFVGRAIIWRIQQTHPEWILYSYDLLKPDFERIYNPPIDTSRVTWLEGDILDLASVQDALTETQPQVVIHTAGIVPALAYRYNRRQQALVYRVNITGTEVMLKAAKATSSVRAFVWTGSVCAVIDDVKYQYPCIDETWKTSKTGSTVYGESKARAETMVLDANDPNPSEERKNPFYTTSLRPSVLFGPEDYQLIPSIHACIAKNEIPYIVGDGTNLWDVTDVRNVAHIHVLAVENLLSDNPTAAGEAFLFSQDTPIPFRDFCCYIWSHWGVYPSWQINIPPAIARFVAGIAGTVSTWLGLQTTFSAGAIGDAIAVRYVDNEKVRKLLGYEPIIGLEEALHESCLDYKKRLELNAVKTVVQNHHKIVT